MGPLGFPHTKTETWLPQWVKPLFGHCQRLLWQSGERHDVVINTSSSFKNQMFVLGETWVGVHLSCCLQLSLIFSSVSSQDPHLCSGGKCDNGHHCQDEQGQLPAKDKGYDDTDSHVGEVLYECGHAHACSLRNRVRMKVVESLAAFRSTWSWMFCLDSQCVTMRTHPLDLGSICSQPCG